MNGCLGVMDYWSDDNMARSVERLDRASALACASICAWAFYRARCVLIVVLEPKEVFRAEMKWQ